MYKAVQQCRICGNQNLVKVLDLGEQTLTGVFPKDKQQMVTRGPIQLVKCDGNSDCCGLLQMAHSYDLNEMYGDNYGYRSGLNLSMVHHLRKKVERILKLVELKGNPIVLDIGSNDGTTLAAYPGEQCIRVGIDPTSEKFSQYHPEGMIAIADFFSATVFNKHFPRQKAKVITSFSMFYDLEKPMEFVKEIDQILDDDGIWVFEQSYMPLMLERNSFDTACHEHLEYYGLRQINWMLERCGMKVVDIEFNDINGGSFSVTAAKIHSKYPASLEAKKIMNDEIEMGLDKLDPYRAFAKRSKTCRDELVRFVNEARNKGQRVAFLGASTKGNVLVQYCNFTDQQVEAVGEVNPDKFGCFTPGSLIPIINENDLLANEPDYLIVLPWHFREFFINKYQLKKASLVFPLPHLEIVQPASAR